MSLYSKRSPLISMSALRYLSALSRIGVCGCNSGKEAATLIYRMRGFSVNQRKFEMKAHCAVLVSSRNYWS